MNQNNKNNPVLTEIAKNIGSFNLTVIVEEDKETLSLLKNIPGLIAFKTTLFKEDQILGIGRGTATLNRMNKFLERGVRYAWTTSLIDAVVRSTKTLDALYLIPTQLKEGADIDLERRDEPAFYGEEDMPQVATDKQRKFLVQLLEKCNDSTKAEYLEQVHSPYFTRFDASELISSLLPMK